MHSISLPAATDKNTLIFGSAGSGKSHALTSLVKQYVKLNKKIFLFGAVRLGKAYPETNQSSYFDLESPLFDKVKAELLLPSCPSYFDLPNNLYQQEYDVIIIDDSGLLSDKSLTELLQLLQNKPKTKFVLAIQDPDKKYKEIRKYFVDAYVGYYDFHTLLRLSEFLGINKNEINICTADQFIQKFLKIKSKMAMK